MPKNLSPHLVATGDRFGSLTVESFSHNDKRHRRHYQVKCDCGTIKTVQGTLLRAGNTKSCGCRKSEGAKARILPNDAGVIGQIILQYKRHAKTRGLEFNLFHKEVDQLVRGDGNAVGRRHGHGTGCRMTTFLSSARAGGADK